MGTVCSILFDAGSHSVAMWGANAASIERLLQNRENHRLLPGAKIPDSVRLTASERNCFRGTTMALSAIPTQFMRQTWARLAPHLPDGVPVVSVAKGIELETLERPSEILRDVLRDAGKSNPIAVVSGPNIAAEIAKYQPGSAVVACADDAIAPPRPGRDEHPLVPHLHQRRPRRRRGCRRLQERHRPRRRHARRPARRQQRQERPRHPPASSRSPASASPWARKPRPSTDLPASAT